MEEGDRIHKTAITNILSEYQIIVGYQGKVKRCCHALEALLEAGTSKDLLIDVVQELSADIIR